MNNNQTIPLKRQTIGVPDVVLKTTSDSSSQSKDLPKYPTEIIPLPTKGHFYAEGHPLSCGEIELKQMTARDEDILSNQQLIKNGKVLDKLIQALIVNKNIKVEEILIPDKNAIFIAIRRLAYGDDYPVSITCPQCSVENKVKINLTELSYKPFNFDDYPKGQNNFVFLLPSGTTITYKLLNQTDEKSIETELETGRKINKENTKEITTWLNYLITSVNGNYEKNIIRKFIEESLSAKDSLAIRKHTKEHNPDVDMTFNFKCSSCDFERRLNVPIGASFLWPDVNA